MILSLIALTAGFLLGFVVSRFIGKQRSAELVTKYEQAEKRREQSKDDAERREEVLRRTLDAKLAMQAKYIEELLSSRFTLRTNSTRIILEVLNLDGDCIDSRIYKGLRTGEGLTMHFVDHRIVSNTPGFAVKDASLIPNESSQGVTLEVISKSKESTAVRLNFPAGATNSQEGVNYGFRYIFDRGILMSREDIAEAYSHDPRSCEAFSHINVIPTDHLEVEVRFPENYKAKCRGIALVKDSIHPEQTKKIKLQTTEQGMLLSIEKPLPGFTYLIEWDSPSRAEIQKLKEGSGGTASAPPGAVEKTNDA